VNEVVVNKSSRHTREGLPDILGALVLITIGIILLANNFAVISWDIWAYIAKFWPVIFIFIGLDMISNKSYLIKAATTSIGLVIIAFILLYCLYSVDIQFRDYIDNNCPEWKKIYNLIPTNKNFNSQRYEILQIPYRSSI
jgi:hypothetical protein